MGLTAADGLTELVLTETDDLPDLALMEEDHPTSPGLTQDPTTVTVPALVDKDVPQPLAMESPRVLLSARSNILFVNGSNSVSFEHKLKKLI